jgi:hypothetical protein
VENWQIAARESIRDLVIRYNSNGDSGRFADVLALFAPDAVMELEDRTYAGIESITTIFTGTRDRLRGDGRQGYVRHFTATHQIDVVSESSASGRCYFSVLSPIGLDHWGRYIDRYRTLDGQWKFAHRRVVIDGRSPQSLFGEETRLLET